MKSKWGLTCLLSALVSVGCYGDAAFEISGVVIDNNGNPVDGASISIVDLTGVLETTDVVSDKNGTFQSLQVYSGMPIEARRIRVGCKKDGYVPLEFVGTMGDSKNAFSLMLRRANEDNEQ